MTIITEWCGWLAGWILLRWAQCSACQTPSPFLLPSSHSHSPCASVPAYPGFAFSSLRHLWSRAAGSRRPSSDISWGRQQPNTTSWHPHHPPHCLSSRGIYHLTSPPGCVQYNKVFLRETDPIHIIFITVNFLYILYFTIGYCCYHRCICAGKITYVRFNTVHGFGILWGTGESPRT